MFLLISLFTFLTATEFKVFYVKKEFDFGNAKNLQKDFYVNMGTRDGLKKDAILNVYRKNQLVDTTSESKIYSAKILVAKLKVISVDSEFSITRLSSLADLSQSPVAGYTQIMVGDTVELSKNEKNTTAFNALKIRKKEPEKNSFFTYIQNFFIKYL